MYIFGRFWVLKKLSGVFNLGSKPYKRLLDFSQNQFNVVVSSVFEFFSKANPMK
jgi:hypothetical protein